MRIFAYVALVCLLLSTTGCIYYDYATDKNNPKLKCGSVYKGYDDNGDYEFTSYLYKLSDENNWVEITLKHLGGEYGKSKNIKKSKLIIRKVKSDKNIEINMKSLKLTHFKDNVELNPISTSLDYSLVKAM